ncbi:MAG: 1-acyl-sn-glycerol-3-phosphate acyltransferase [Geodermatophilaceae bacterium]|nr:1-acyl-sn-glycerol-3-phosphate acyltransferase [Geodermatophilaceae bacterium]
MSRPRWVDEQVRIVSGPDWPVWPMLLRYGAPLVSLFGRITVTSELEPGLLNGPLLLAANHIGNFDTTVIAIGCRRVGVVPKFLVTGGIMAAPVVGPFLTRSGHIRVDRGGPDAALALEVTAAALRHGGHVVVYPEGRISLDPGLWPERGRTGVARLALSTRVPVIPVSQWGAHEVTAYEGAKAMVRTTASAIWRQPRLAVHFGVPVRLEDLEPGRRGDANRARTRITAAITEGLRPLRAAEPELPRFHDRTRPVILAGTAAFPGGRVPGPLPRAAVDLRLRG